MAARRCSRCGVCWPTKGHDTCPGCGEKTDYFANAEPSDPTTLFEAFYLGRGEREVEIDFDAEYPGISQIAALESIPTLDAHPTDAA